MADEQWPEEFKLLNCVVNNDIEGVAAELVTGTDINLKNAEVPVVT